MPASPRKTEKTPSKKSRKARRSDAVSPSIAEARRDFGIALKQAFPSRRKKRSLDDETEFDAAIQSFCDRMKDAALRDIELYEHAQSATNKLQMLPAVIDQLSRYKWRT